jgi:hypothetical protein
VPYALFSASGTTGAQGIQGLPGANGTTGAVGPTGATGVAGTNGLVGATGATGLTGSNGTNGLVGATGATGATGAAGTNGTNGLFGATGLDGVAGPQGLTGATGAAGTNGTNGLVGATGLTGDVGATGLAGATGPQGLTGATGLDGATGPQGSAGAAGQGGVTQAGLGISVTGTGTVADRYIVSTKIYTIGLWPELGGYVFLISADGKHGLVAETQDQGINTWYGSQNLMSNPSTHSTNGQKFMDWRVPTIFELTQMYNSQSEIGGFNNFTSYFYWSSMENDSTNAYDFSFFDGSASNLFNKDNTFYVRGVRAF